MEACTLCREKYPGDGDRCEENRKPVPDEPGEAAKISAQAAEKPLSSASLTAVLLNAGAPSGGVRSGSGLRPCRGDGRSACRALACARVREHPAAVDTAMGRSEARDMRKRLSNGELRLLRAKSACRGLSPV